MKVDVMDTIEISSVMAHSLTGARTLVIGANRGV